MKINFLKCFSDKNKIAAVLMILLSAWSVFANVAAPSQGGNLAGEPTGLEKIFITRERLTIDFRPLGQLQSAMDKRNISVEAVYEVENMGEAINQTLVFATGARNAEDFKIWIDDRQIERTEIVEGNLPVSWQAPKETPWKDGRQLMYAPSRNLSRGIRFQMNIPPGRHQIKASYQSEAAVYAALEPLKAWQFAYILAPAREWAGFGNLDVTVYLPEKWEAVTAPELQREADVLRGSFTGIPADALAITARAPLPKNYRTIQTVGDVAFWAILIAFPLLIIFYAWRRGDKLKLWWLWGIALNILWSALIFAAGMLVFYGANYTIPDAQYSTYGYGDPFAFLFVLFVSAAALVVGTGLWMLIVYLKRRRTAVSNS